MPIYREWSGIAERIGSGTNDFIDVVAEEVRGFACNLWAAYPDYISQNKSLGASFARGYMNNLCADLGTPPPPFSDFNGGQCPGVNYVVSYTLQTTNIDNCTRSAVINKQVQVVGPISNIKFIQTAVTTRTTNCNNASNELLVKGNYYIEHGNGITNLSSNQFADPGGQANPPLSEVIITGVVRTDGLPDDCGNPDPSYPKSNPDATDFVDKVYIPNEDGLDLSLELEYNPINFNFPMDIKVNGIETQINIGGFQIVYNPVDVNGNPFKLPNGDNSPLPLPKDEGNKFKYTRKYPTPNNEDFEEIVKSPEDPKEEEVGLELEFVRVTIINPPKNIKQQSGNDAPRIVFVGWFEFQGEGFNFPRQPIHFDNSLFRSPEGATGYAYTVYNGISAAATIYKSKLEEDNGN